MTDHERAAVDAFHDYAAKLQKCDELLEALRKAQDAKDAAWSLLQRLARLGR